MTLPFLARFLTLKNVHPILTHMSNGLTPIAFLFAVGARFYPVECLDEASHLMMTFVALITPFTMATGIVDWKYRYEFRRIQVIDRKVVTAVIGYAFVLAYIYTHQIVALALALLFFAITGEYGGRLVHGAVNRALIKKYQNR